MANRAPVNFEIYGSIEQGQELYHEVNLYAGETFIFILEAADEQVDLDFYIADYDGNVLYRDEEQESGAAARFQVEHGGICTLMVKAVDGDTDYRIKIEEQ